MNDELGWSFYFAQDYEAAVTQLKQAVKLNPDYGPAHGHLGVTYFTRQNWEEAAVHLERAIELGGRRLEYYYELGLAYVYQRKCDKAQTWIAKAQELAPTEAAVVAAGGYYNQHCLGIQPTPGARASATPSGRGGPSPSATPRR